MLKKASRKVLDYLISFIGRFPGESKLHAIYTALLLDSANQPQVTCSTHGTEHIATSCVYSKWCSSFS